MADTTVQNGININTKKEVILGVDHLRNYWPLYEETVGSMLVMATSTSEVKDKFDSFEVKGIIVQVNSLGDPNSVFDFDVLNTKRLIMWLLDQEYQGPIIVVVSMMLDSDVSAELMALSFQVEAMEKSEFFKNGSKWLSNG